MKKWFVVGLGFVMLGVVALPAEAQIIDFNGNVVVGASYLLTDPGAGVTKARFFLTANVTGFKVANNVYFGGAGVKVPDFLADSPGLGLSIPVLTYYPKGKQWLFQAGYSRDLMGDIKTNGAYIGIGWGFTSPTAITTKRAVKKTKKKAERELRELLLRQAQLE